MGVRGHREEHIQGVRDAMTGLDTSLPPGIEIGEQAVVAAGAVVRDS
jgi:acetyltransferase-like isoleucine patch superfamily enzyme